MAKPKSPPEPGRPKPLIVPPRKEHTHTVILFHDQGDKGREFGRGFLKAMKLQDHVPTVRFVFPCAFNAPLPPSTSGGKREAGPPKRRVSPTQWFDDPFHVREAANATASLPETAEFLQRLVHEEAKVLTQTGRCGMHQAHKRIFIGGKGQGGAAALLYLAGSHRRLGGFIGLDAALPWQYHMEIAVQLGAAEGSCGDDSVSRGVQCVRSLLGFKRLGEEERRLADRLCQLETPVCFVYEGSREKGRNLVSLFADGFGMDITKWWCENGAKECHASSDSMKAVLGFLEKVGVPRMYPVSEREGLAKYSCVGKKDVQEMA
jgi:predicted esterase